MARLLCVLTILLGLTAGTSSAQDVRGVLGAAAAAMGANDLSSIQYSATGWIANRISKHRALMLNTTIYSLTLITLIVLPKGNFAAAVPTMFVAGAMAAGLTVMIRALTADIGDEIRLESGREWMGLMYALTNATTKVAGAASIFLTFNVLAVVVQHRVVERVDALEIFRIERVLGADPLRRFGPEIALQQLQHRSQDRQAWHAELTAFDLQPGRQARLDQRVENDAGRGFDLGDHPLQLF